MRSSPGPGWRAEAKKFHDHRAGAASPRREPPPLSGGVPGLGLRPVGGHRPRPVEEGEPPAAVRVHAEGHRTGAPSDYATAPRTPQRGGRTSGTLTPSPDGHETCSKRCATGSTSATSWRAQPREPISVTRAVTGMTAATRRRPGSPTWTERTGRDVPARGRPPDPPGPHPPTPPQLVWARRVSDEGPALAELGTGAENRVKDEAPPLARRRGGSGLSGFSPLLSVLACGGGVSFRFSAPAVHGGGPVLLGGFSFLAPAVSVCGRVRFGVVSFAGRGRCAFGVARSVSLLCAERAGAPAGRTVSGSGSVHRRWGSSRSRGWGGATAGHCVCRGELFPWRGGVPPGG